MTRPSVEPDHPDADVAPVLRLRLEPSSGAAAAARRLVDRACSEWHVQAILDPARLVVTELVSNAVRHARTQIQVTLHRRAHELRIEVHDNSPESPRPAKAVRSTSEGGRGLIVVAALTTAWGATHTATGKIVWATLALT